MSVKKHIALTWNCKKAHVKKQVTPYTEKQIGNDPNPWGGGRVHVDDWHTENEDDGSVQQVVTGGVSDGCVRRCEDSRMQTVLALAQLAMKANGG